MLFTMEMCYNFNIKCNFIHGHKSTAFPVQVITELTNAEAAVRSDIFNFISFQTDNKCGKYGYK